MTKDHNFSENQDTQPIDSLPSSPSDSGEEKDGFFGNLGDEFMNDTVPFEDDAWINDEFKETQVIDNDEFLLCRETQAVDLGFQTQEEPFVEDEQLLQGFDGLATQVLDPSDEDSDDVDVTVFLVDNREVSDCGDSSSRRKLLSSEDKSRERADENMKPMGALDAPSSGHENVKPTGKVARFASVRSAAFRASAVSAQKLLNRDSPTLASCHSSGQGATTSSLLQQHFGEVGNQNCPPNTFVEKKNEGKRTARKLLFEDDSPEENCPSPGLSYIDSQEPGEASQASALKFVDKLISESGLNFDVEAEADYGRRTEEKLDKISSVKGPLELAKKASYKARALGNSMFEWDDNREDEGGGDICLRRKEELFGAASKAQRRSSVPREQRRELEVSVDKSQRRAHSDSRLLQRCVTRGPKMIQAAKKNLGKELDAVSEEELGYETQVAAEAVDAVRSGGRSKVNGEASPGNKLSPGEERVITRQSKGTKRIQAMGKEELLRRRMNKASPSPAKACRKSIERSLQSDQLDKGGPYCSKRRIVHTAPRESRDNLVDEMDEVSKESKTRMFNRREEVEAGPDTQMAAEVISALHSGDARDEAKKSSRGVVTRKSKRLKGIQAVDDDIESLKPKTKKAKSVLVKAYSKNEKLDLPDEVVVSKLLKQPSGGEADVLSYPKRRRSARFLQDQVNEAERSSEPDFDTPVKSKEPSKNVSPICMGDEYHRLSCKDSRTSNTTREFRNLTSPLMEPVPETKSTRKRRDLGSVRVLFSQHLDEDVTKHQKKILARFDISEASSMTEATHFVADNFTRTRNMLEAIASGKPVVTTQWLESIDQVNIYVDEDLYILRDSKKEKEFGFNMGVSLARARQNPLLKGRRVFITPNTKPGLNTITTLVKAVHGQPVERVGRSVLSDEKVPENLLVLSCEEDRDISVPFLERGAEVYSSELVLNGIVTQKLEYERYRLFTDRVRRTRSTIWIRDGKGKFQRRRG
ncbi:BnaC05g30620D [Brassica napus]|uniref:BnaC05g30620D protein n=1 Tax=Brassica napus TaxID=3708 RepID=A0A078I383_BRANA|nr:BnaC05g30620D [Brassica napus]